MKNKLPFNKFALLLLFVFPLSGIGQWDGWSEPITITDSEINNTDATIAYLHFVEDNIYMFWVKSLDSSSTSIYYKSFYDEQDEGEVFQSADGIHFKNPQLIDAYQNATIDTSLIVIYEEDSKGYNDISYKVYTSNGFTSQVPLTDSPFPKFDLMANYVGDIVWLEQNRVMYMFYDRYNYTFSEPLVLDSGNCSFPSVVQPDANWGWGDFPVVSWIKSVNDSTQIKLKRQTYPGDWQETETIFTAKNCTNLSFGGGFGFVEILSWDNFYDGLWHLNFYHTYENEIFEMEFTQQEPFYPFVFTGDMPVKTNYIGGIACISFISNNGDNTDVMTSPYLFDVSLSIDGYANISETENEVRRIRTFMGKSEPGCKQYFINIWEEKVSEYWQLKYSETWTCLSAIEESSVNDFRFVSSPNPFQHSIEFSFLLDQPEMIELSVYDLMGNNLVNLEKGKLSAGEHLYKWTGETVPNGMYFVSLQTNTQKITSKIILSK